MAKRQVILFLLNIVQIDHEIPDLKGRAGMGMTNLREFCQKTGKSYYF